MDGRLHVYPSQGCSPSIVSQQWIGVTVSGILFLLFVHEAYGEQVFFSRYLQAITKELRSMEAKAEAE